MRLVHFRSPRWTLPTLLQPYKATSCSPEAVSRISLSRNALTSSSITRIYYKQTLTLRGEPLSSSPIQTTAQFFDLYLRISDVDEKGCSRNVTETYERFASNADAHTMCMELQDCAHRFCKGCRIRILIAGSALPRYFLDGLSELIKHRVYYQSDPVSKIVLPVIGNIQRVAFGYHLQQRNQKCLPSPY